MRLAALGFVLLLCACASEGARDPGPATPVVEVLARQEILTPLPLRVSLPAASGAEHVVALVRTWGSRGWHEMYLQRQGQTWSGEVSCRDVSTVTGDTRYFFVALDEGGNVVSGSGTPEWPHLATIVRELPEGPQALPGGNVPMRCHDVADCPPDFPGCPAYQVKRSACSSNRECSSDQRCAWDGYCTTIHGPDADDIPFDATEDEETQLARAVRVVKARHRASAGSSRSTQ